MGLFRGLDRAYGTYEVVTTKAQGPKLVGSDKTIKTIIGAVDEQLWSGHLEGKRRVGIVPIRDDATCFFGAIDIDVYEGLNYAAIARGVKELNFPLVPCRSKSGGIHLYAFCKEPIRAETLQGKLKEFAATLGYGTSEIFPKQIMILADRGDVGNWINMPYFEGDRTSAYGLKFDGSPMTMREFLDYAQALQISPETLVKVQVSTAGDLRDGPPCLQYLAKHGLPSGTRNDGLFNFAVYARKSNPDNWEKDLGEYNAKYLRPPLTDTEVQGVIKSASRKDYIYTCSKQPIKSYCNSGLCRTRKHGVGAMVGMPILNGLTKYDSRPPVWFVDIDGGGRIELTTEDLQNQGRFQKRCMEALNTMPMAIKPGVWHAMVQALLEKVVIIEAPADASPDGQLFEHLERFCTSKAQARNRDELLLGKPWVEHGRVYFRLSDFIGYLERQHFRYYNSTQIASMLKERNGEHSFFNLKGKGCNCWSMPQYAVQTESHDIPHIDNKEIF